MVIDTQSQAFGGLDALQQRAAKYARAHDNLPVEKIVLLFALELLAEQQAAQARGIKPS